MGKCGNGTGSNFGPATSPIIRGGESGILGGTTDRLLERERTEERMTEPNKLDEKGRCCGRKPIVYRRPPQLFCSRCDRSFDVDTGLQRENWAWGLIDGQWVSKRKSANLD